MMNIYLIGFMGAGKSVVGVELARLLNIPFIDMDETIIKSEQLSINEIFSCKGEHFFRDLETSCLKTLIDSAAKIVSTGGGLIERSENRKLLNYSGKTVYLETEWEDILQRIRSSSERPLVVKEDSWDKTYTLYQKRLPLYRKADFIVKTANQTPEEIAVKISNKLKI